MSVKGKIIFMAGLVLGALVERFNRQIVENWMVFAGAALLGLLGAVLLDIRADYRSRS